MKEGSGGYVAPETGKGGGKGGHSTGSSRRNKKQPRGNLISTKGRPKTVTKCIGMSPAEKLNARVTTTGYREEFREKPDTGGE